MTTRYDAWLTRDCDRGFDGPDITRHGWTWIGKRKDGTQIYRRRDRYSRTCEIKTEDEAIEIVEQEIEDACERADYYDRMGY